MQKRDLHLLPQLVVSLKLFQVAVTQRFDYVCFGAIYPII